MTFNDLCDNIIDSSFRDSMTKGRLMTKQCVANTTYQGGTQCQQKALHDGPSGPLCFYHRKVAGYPEYRISPTITTQIGDKIF